MWTDQYGRRTIFRFVCPWTKFYGTSMTGHTIVDNGYRAHDITTVWMWDVCSWMRDAGSWMRVMTQKLSEMERRGLCCQKMRMEYNGRMRAGNLSRGKTSDVDGEEWEGLRTNLARSSEIIVCRFTQIRRRFHPPWLGGGFGLLGPMGWALSNPPWGV